VKKPTLEIHRYPCGPASHNTKTMASSRASTLLTELKSSDFLPSYNEEIVRSSLTEIASHTDELTDLVRAANRYDGSEGIPISSRPSMILHDATIRRTKRCLLAYHGYRIDKLRNLRWATSGTLPPSIAPLLNESEVEFFRAYDKLCSNTSLLGSLGTLDYTSDMDPPSENFVMVRVVEGGLGKIETESCGVVELEVGTMHYLPRGDVEGLLRRGALVQLSGEEC
jgi:GINS complex subunit 1